MSQYVKTTKIHIFVELKSEKNGFCYNLNACRTRLVHSFSIRITINHRYFHVRSTIIYRRNIVDVSLKYR